MSDPLTPEVNPTPPADPTPPVVPPTPPQVEPPKEAPYVPLTETDLQITLPEGATLDKDLQTGFLNLVNERKLPREVTDDLVKLHNGALQRMVETQAREWNDLQDKWRGEVENHPKFGGANLEPSLGKISEFINKFSSDPNGARQVIDQTGLGNNPLMVELFLAAASAVSEGTPAVGQPAAGADSLANKLYPTMKGN